MPVVVLALLAWLLLSVVTVAVLAALCEGSRRGAQRARRAGARPADVPAPFTLAS